MGRLEIKRKRSLAFRKSDKILCLGWTVFLTALSFGISTYVCAFGTPDIIALRVAKTSEFYVLLVRAASSQFFRWAAMGMIVGLFIILIGWLNKKDEDDGNAPVPPEFE